MMMVAFVLGLVIMMMKAHYKRGNPTPLALKQTSISFLLKPASFAQMAVFLASAIFSNLANTIQNIANTNDEYLQIPIHEQIQYGMLQDTITKN